MNRTFFICADGKKTALGCAGRTFWIAANRVAGTIFVSCNLFHQDREKCDAKPLHRRYSVIEKHPDVGKTKRNKTLAGQLTQYIAW